MANPMFSNDLTAIIRAMEDADQGLFVAAVVTLLRDVNTQHRPDEDGDCEGPGCPNMYGETEYNLQWPCATWLLAQRVGVSWLMERAVRPDSGRTPDGIPSDSEGIPEDRAREQARARKARQRQREREGQESDEPQVDPSRPQGTSGGLPQGLAEGLPLGLAPATRMRSQGDRDSVTVTPDVTPGPLNLA